MKYLRFTNNTQVGFTLIELMITLILGLLISAAALQLFYNTSRNVRIQESADDVQDAVVFSLGYIQKEISMANLGSFTPMTYNSAWTGIVFTTSEDDNTKPNLPSGKGGGKPQIGNLRGVNLGTTPSDKIISKITKSTNKNPTSNVNVASDQLVIQYKAPFRMTDCEGQNREKGDIIIERFYTAQDTSATSKDPRLNIALYCDAGTYTLNQTYTDDNGNTIKTNSISPSEVAKSIFKLNGIDNKSTGIILINRVDYFKALLGIQLTNGIHYMSLDDYQNIMNGSKTPSSSPTKSELQNAPIVSVKIGVITRGVSPISTETQKQFNVLGDTVTISDDSKEYIRRVYEHTIRLRNGVAK